MGKAFTKGRIGLSSVRPFPEVLRGEASREDSLDPLGWVGSIVNDVFSQACVGCRTLFTHKRRGGTWGSSCLFPPGYAFKVFTTEFTSTDLVHFFRPH